MRAVFPERESGMDMPTVSGFEPKIGKWGRERDRSWSGRHSEVPRSYRRDEGISQGPAIKVFRRESRNPYSR